MRRLKIEFAEPTQLSAEFERNIAVGGAQIPTRERFELREFVEVEFCFSWRSEMRVLEAEVVFSGGGKVAVQFRKSASELRAELAPFMPQGRSVGAAKRGPRFEDFSLEDDEGAGPSADSEGPTELEAPDPGGKTAVRIGREQDPLAAVADRRKSPRAAARVPARLQSTHVHLEGRTRDLSETGVLISADGSDLPLGKPVELELQHPESGERLTVRGKVVRHIETEGTVAAVGVHFETPAERESELRNFVHDVKRAEAERARSGISGRIEELGIANLIQMLGQSSPCGTLTATHGTEEATFAFENGALAFAELGSLRGVKALARALQWSAGTFQFYKHVDASTVRSAPIPLQNALLEATRHVDESARGAPFDMKRRFRVERDAIPPAGELTKLEEAVLDLAAAGLTVRRMVDVIPDSDGAVQGTIRSLLERGILMPKG